NTKEIPCSALSCLCGRLLLSLERPCAMSQTPFSLDSCQILSLDSVYQSEDPLRSILSPRTRYHGLEDAVRSHCNPEFDRDDEAEFWNENQGTLEDVLA